MKKNSIIKQEYTMDNASIDRLSECIGETLSQNKTSNEDILRFRLCAEEVAVFWAKKLGADKTCLVESTRKKGRVQIILKVKGEELNPIENINPEYSVMDTNNLVSALGMTPEYRYEGGYNILILTQPRKQTSMAKIVISATLAVVLGVLCRYMFPSIGMVLLNYVISPFSRIFLKILSLVAGPLIFLSLLSGMTGVGSFKAFGKVGKIMIGRFFNQSFGPVLFATPFVLLFLPLSINNGGIQNLVPAIENLLIDIVPADMINPFLTGNAIQIVCLAFVLGIGLLLNKNISKPLFDTINQIYVSVQLIMNGLSKYIPLFVFASIFDISFNSNFISLKMLIIPTVILVGAGILWIIGNAIFVCVAFHESFIDFLKKIMPSIIVGFTTSSSIAAYQKEYECCSRDLGMKASIINFSIPLSQILSKAGSALTFFLLVVFVRNSIGMELTIFSLITLVIICPILATTTPPVPGGVLIMISMLFSYVGIPDSYVPMVSGYLVIIDMIISALNVAAVVLGLYFGNTELNRADS